MLLGCLLSYSVEAFEVVGFPVAVVESFCCGFVAVLILDGGRKGIFFGLRESLEFAPRSGCVFFAVCSSDSEFEVAFSTTDGFDWLEELSPVRFLANFALAAAWACLIFSMWN